MRSIQILTLILSVAMLLSCKKEENHLIQSEGILIWTGDYSVDGCGFFITIENNKSKPENESVIDDNFKTSEDIQVIVEYEKLNKEIESWCGDKPEPTVADGIKIFSIKKK